MEMVDRYIYAVIQKLPQDQRKDIADELRGLIEDLLNERVEDGEVTDEDIEAVLRSLGHPRKLADKYRGAKRYIIGPETFDSYILVLKIVLSVMGAIIGIGFIFNTIFDPTAIIDHFVESIVAIVTTIPTAFGWTTLAFAIGEYYGGTASVNFQKGQEWKLTDLPQVPHKKRQIKRSEPISGIIFYMILLAIVIFSPEYIGVWIFHDGFSGVVPFFNDDAPNRFIFFVIIILGLGVIKESIKLVYGKWSIKLVTLMAAVNLMSLIIVIMMVTGSNIWNPNFIYELTQAELLTGDSKNYEVVKIIWEKTTTWIVAILIIGLITEAIYGAVKVFREQK